MPIKVIPVATDRYKRAATFEPPLCMTCFRMLEDRQPVSGDINYDRPMWPLGGASDDGM